MRGIIEDMNEQFWAYLHQLVLTSELIIDRPKGSQHPRYPQVVYPVDYGYLAGTTAGDGVGIDVWRGTLSQAELQGVVMTVDLTKRDAEIKILIGCTPDEISQIETFHNKDNMQAIKCLKISMKAEE